MERKHPFSPPLIPYYIIGSGIHQSPRTFSSSYLRKTRFPAGKSHYSITSTLSVFNKWGFESNSFFLLNKTILLTKHYANTHIQHLTNVTYFPMLLSAPELRFPHHPPSPISSVKIQNVIISTLYPPSTGDPASDTKRKQKPLTKNSKFPVLPCPAVYSVMMNGTQEIHSSAREQSCVLKGKTLPRNLEVERAKVNHPINQTEMFPSL